MFRVFSVRVLLLVISSLLLGTTAARADLRFEARESEGGIHFIVVSGDFAYVDNLAPFVSLVKTSGAIGVSFESAGGNIQKAMQLGRLIRALGLATVQPRSSECASACSLAFLGGVMRFAEPGSIGVHKSSFGSTLGLTTSDAVSGVQQTTAEIIAYMVEMGVDPALLQLSLQYDSDDIRYLSKSEMEKYKVVTDSLSGEPDQVANLPPASRSAPRQSSTHPTEAALPPASRNSPVVVPQARSGRVRHPKGEVPLKALPTGKSASLVNLRNGTPVTILGNVKRWYHVQAGGRVGYMHDTWVYVDQYDASPFAERHVQIKSFDNLADAVSYARAAPMRLSAYLATNGWFAITLEDTYDVDTAKSLTRKLKDQGAIPGDSYVTYGNTYALKVCCE